jgi:hypothetical protein
VEPPELPELELPELAPPAVPDEEPELVAPVLPEEELVVAPELAPVVPEELPLDAPLLDAPFEPAGPASGSAPSWGVDEGADPEQATTRPSATTERYAARRAGSCGMKRL